MDLLSIVVPCYDEQDIINLFYIKLKEQLSCDFKDVDYELIFVDDGSKDGTLTEIKKICATDKNVSFISFSRNFGKESAMLAGLKETKGNYVVIMDADLQHPPQLLRPMYESICNKEFDCAATKRNRIGDDKCKTFFTHIFYKLMNILSHTKIVDGSGDYRMMTRQVVDALLSMGEYNRFLKGMFGWVGFKTKWIEYDNVPRAAGKTKWSLKRLLAYSLEGIVSFSTIPLLLASFLGIFFCIAAAIYLIFVVVKTLIFGDPVAGYPTLICIMLLIGGVQLLCMGIIGEYISKIYLESKKRPNYIIKEKRKSASSNHTTKL